MDFKYLSYFLVFFLLTGCKNTLDIEDSLSCKSKTPKNTVRVTDFKNNFSLPIPKSWKINHYYTTNQSEIFAADTLKQLSESYIIDASFNNGTLKLDDQFYKNADSILKMNQLIMIRSGRQDYDARKTYWYLVNGKKNGFTYHEFNWIIFLSENTYANMRTEVYGDQNINERICESISILKEIIFLE